MATLESFKTNPYFEFGSLGDMYFRATDGKLTAIAIGTASGLVLATTGNTATPYAFTSAGGGGASVAVAGDLQASTASGTVTASLTVVTSGPLSRTVSTSSPATVTLGVNLAAAGGGVISTGTNGTATVTVNVIAGSGIGVTTSGGTATISMSVGTATATSFIARRIQLQGEFFATGDAFEFPIFSNGAITQCEIVGDAAGGTATCDVLVAHATSTLTFSSIVASDPPTLAGTQRVVDTALTGWTTTLTSGDTLRMKLTTMTGGLGRVALTVVYTVTDLVTVNSSQILTLQREFTAQGQTLELTVDDNMVIQSCVVVADTTTATATISVQRAPGASTLTFASIVGTSTPAITGAQRLVDNTLAGWSTTLTAGDTLRFSSVGFSNAARVAIGLKCIVGTGFTLPALRLEDLTDFVVSGGTPSSGDVVTYSGGHWTNLPSSGSGGGHTDPLFFS